MVARRTRSRPGSARTTGLILAGAVLAIFAAVIGFFALRPDGQRATNPSLTSTETPPDIKLIQSGASETGINTLGGTSGFFLQIVDEKDPTLVRGEITAARSEPLEARSYRLEKPKGWMFLKDGRTVYLESDFGQAYVPDDGPNARPRDGVLEGNVVVRLFAALPGGTRPNPANQTPLVIVKTDLLRFDGALGKVDIPNRVTTHSDNFDFVGEGLTLLYNEEHQQLESLRILRHIFAEYRPGPTPQDERSAKAPSPGTPPPLPTARVPPGPLPGPPPPPTPTPVESLYRLVCPADVVLTQAGRRITSDQLEVWVRMIDNKIPEGAIPSKTSGGTKRQARSPARQDGPVVLAVSSARTAPQPTQQGLSSSPDNSQPITLAWSGPLEVRPLASTPGELSFNDLFIRFTSAADRGVTFAEERSGATAFGSLLDYGVTKRELTLAGIAPLGAQVVLSGRGEAQANRFNVDLATGDAHVGGAGILTGAVNEDGVRARHRQLSWLSQADFDFAVVDGEMTSRLTEARASGGVVATDGEGRLTGASFTALFVPLDQTNSRIDHLKVVGQVVGTDGRAGELSSDTLDVAFEASEDGSESDPVLLTAQGSVRGVRDLAVLESELLEAHITRDATKQLVVTRLDARESVTFTGEDGVTATGDRLEADPVAEVAVLTGAHATIAKTGTSVSGQAMKLENADRRMTVLSPGVLNHSAPATVGSPATRATATWSRQLVVEDRSGRIVVEGNAHAEWTQGPLAKDTLDANTINLSVTPDPGETSDEPKQARRLLYAEAIGTLPASEGGTPASIEVRRYAPPTSADTQPKLQRLMYLQGARILADNDKGTISVPVAGKLLAMDSRDIEQEGAVSQSPFDTSGGGARGSSLFNWKGSLFMNRAAGTVDMVQGVRMTHKRLGEARPDELECESLTASFSEPPPPDGGKPALTLDQQFRGELVSSLATGAVWMRSGLKELTADRLLYDARSKSVHASAQEGNTATLFDPAATTPLNARQLTWDLASDKVRVEDLSPVTTPR